VEILASHLRELALELWHRRLFDDSLRDCG